jgi:hypothetical protein
VGENFKASIRWLAGLHAPLGHWAPIAASALFAASSLSHFTLLRVLAYSGAIVLAILVAADVARSFIDEQSFPAQTGHAKLTLPMLAFRLLLTGVLGSIYTFLVFTGLGWAPFILLPVLFVICSLIAWRNVDLWYAQGVKFEEELKEEEHHQSTRFSQVPGRRMP